MLLILVSLSCKNDNVVEYKLSAIPYEIVYAAGRDNTPNPTFDIFVMHKDLTITKLTEGEQNFSPEWSPEGNRIAYWMISPAHSKIIVMMADGSRKTNITSVSPFVTMPPKWSRDGSMLVYDAGAMGLGIINADGSNERYIRTDQYVNYYAWEPDGLRVLYTKKVGRKMQVFSAMNNGTDERLVTTDTTRSHFYASVSPNGRFVIFNEQLDSSTTAVVVLDRTNGNTRVIAAPALFGIWSPDNTWVYYHDGRSNEPFLMSRVHPEGTGREDLSHRPSSQSYSDAVIDISPDGAAVLFWSTRSGYSAYYMMNSDGADPVVVLNDSTVRGVGGWRPR